MKIILTVKNDIVAATKNADGCMEYEYLEDRYEIYFPEYHHVRLDSLKEDYKHVAKYLDKVFNNSSQFTNFEKSNVEENGYHTGDMGFLSDKELPHFNKSHIVSYNIEIVNDDEE